MRVLTSSILVLASVALGTQVTRADDVPADVSRAHAVVQKDADKILKAAYPTAGHMTAPTEGTYHDRLGAGYSLDEKFAYTDSDGAAQSFTLRFTLDGNGAITAISEQERSELWPTFGTGNLLLAVAKAAAQDQVDKARQNHQDPPPAALLILKADDFKDVVVVGLNADR